MNSVGSSNDRSSFYPWTWCGSFRDLQEGEKSVSIKAYVHTGFLSALFANWFAKPWLGNHTERYRKVRLPLPRCFTSFLTISSRSSSPRSWLHSRGRDDTCRWKAIPCIQEFMAFTQRLLVISCFSIFDRHLYRLWRSAPNIWPGT